MKAYTSAQEIAENQPFTNYHDQGVMRSQDSKGRTSYMEESFGTANTLLSSETQAKRSIICEKNHWSEECRTISTLQERKEKAKGKC